MTAARRNNPEEQLQTAVCKFLALALDGNSWFGSVPLGGGGLSRGARLKRTGARKGTPDLLVINDGRCFWLELKAPRGVVTDDQLYCHAQLRKARSPVYIVRSIDDAIAALQAAGVPLKARLAA